jgi:serine/threonine protein kinase
MASDGAKGMLYLHARSPPIIHRDLKSPNLLVDALWHVKISDFNLSRAMEANAAVSSLAVTNPRWLAPEVLKGSAATPASDVYSFGVVLWELMTWELPWADISNSFQIIALVTDGAQLPLPPPDALPAGPLRCYDEFVALVRECWARDPAARPAMADVAQRLRGMLGRLVAAQRGEGGVAAAPAPA